MKKNPSSAGIGTHNLFSHNPETRAPVLSCYHLRHHLSWPKTFCCIGPVPGIESFKVHQQRIDRSRRNPENLGYQGSNLVTAASVTRDQYYKTNFPIKNCCKIMARFWWFNWYISWRFVPASSVWPDWAIYWTLGDFSKPLATISLPKSTTFLGVKILNLSSEIIFRQLL